MEFDGIWQRLIIFSLTLLLNLYCQSYQASFPYYAIGLYPAANLFQHAIFWKALLASFL